MFNKIKSLFFSKRETNAQGDVDPVFGSPSEKPLIPIFDYAGAVAMYKSNAILAGCANLNSKTVSSLPLKLFAYTNGRTEKEMKEKSPWRLKKLNYKTKAFLRGELTTKPSAQVMQKYIDSGGYFVEVDDPMHPVLLLLGQGSAEYRQSISNGTSQTQGRILDLQLTGNYYLQAIIKNGIPSELWNVPAAQMKIEAYKTGSKLIKNYWWGVNDTNMQKLSPQEIIHGKNYNPDGEDLYYGQSMVEPCWYALYWLLSLDKMQIAQFKNMNIPTLFAKLQGATRDQLTRFERAYNNKLRGPENAGKMLTTSNDVDFITPSFSRGKDALTDSIPVSYTNKVTEIAFAMGVPVSRIFSMDTNLASMFITDQGWMRDTISHLCHYDEATLNEYLLPLFGLENDVFLAYDNIIPRDEEKIETRLISLKSNGIISAETVRQELGYSEEDAPKSEQVVEEVIDSDSEGEPGERAPRGSSEEFQNGDSVDNVEENNNVS